METGSFVMLALGVVAGAAGGFGASRLRGGAAAKPASAAERAASAPATGQATPEGEAAVEFQDPAGFEVVAQRRALVDAYLSIADRLRDSDEALFRQLTDALAAAGVSMVAPDGQPFDPEQHVSVLTEPTQDETLHQTVANTAKAGYLDGTTWLRRPEVAVYEQAQAGQP
jgi:hypothetical protein